MDNKAAERKFRRPMKTLIWTLIAIGGILGLKAGGGWLNDTLQMDPAIINLFTMLLVLSTVIAWFSWLAFFSRLRFRFLIAAVGISLIVLFFRVFQFQFDGDMGFARIEPRFMKREFRTIDTSTSTGIDLRTTSALDFNQFLGNNRDAVVRGRVLNSNWDQHPPKLLWKHSVGRGWSGFSAVNGFAVSQEQRGQDECVTCYDIQTGELKWIHSIPRRHEDTMAMGKVGPRATPTIHEGRVYVQGATGILDCLNGSDGTVMWSADVADLLGIELVNKTTTTGFDYEFEDSRLSWGRSGSPLVYKDIVIVPGGGDLDGPYSTLIALDKNTGAEKWRGGDQMIAYGSPSLAQLMGQTQITLVAEASAMGFDPENGNVLWETPREGASNANANCSQVTRIADNRILLSKAYQLGGELVQLTRNDEQIDAETIWKNARVLKTKMMSPVVYEDHAYCLSDGFLECSNVADDQLEGKRRWRKRGRFGNGQLLLVGDRLLVHTEYGVLKLVAANPEKYEELGAAKTIDGVCWNTICLYDRFLIVRSELEAACFELKTEVQSAIQETPETVSVDQTSLPDGSDGAVAHADKPVTANAPNSFDGADENGS